MSSLTTNYSFIIPAVNDPTDEDLWGGYLNTNWTALDATLKLIDRTGKIEPCFDATAPSTWLFLDGLTIGSASSGSDYANADAENLFLFFWTNLADAEAPVVTGRGASAAADWAANKRLTLPDFRNRVLAGGDMGGGASGRLTTGVSGVDGTTVGASGGEEELHAHSHSVTDAGHSHSLSFSFASAMSVSAGGTPFYNAAGSTTGSATTGISIVNAGAGSSENVQPTIIVNWIVKL